MDLFGPNGLAPVSPRTLCLSGRGTVGPGGGFGQTGDLEGSERDGARSLARS